MYNFINSLFSIYKAYFLFTAQIFFAFELLCMRFFFDTIFGFYFYSIMVFYSFFANNGTVKETIGFIFCTHQIGVSMLFFIIFSIPFSKKYALYVLKEVPVKVTGDLSFYTFLSRVVLCWGFILIVFFIEFYSASINFTTDMVQLEQLQQNLCNEQTPLEMEQSYENFVKIIKSAPAQRGIVFSTVDFVKNFIK